MVKSATFWTSQKWPIMRRLRRKVLIRPMIQQRCQVDLQQVICSYFSLTGVNVMCCRIEIEVKYYWLGLYKIISQPGSGSYWYATRWYDGSTSTYRWWADGYPLYLQETCIAYTKNGWKDQPCSYEYYFIVKKPAGCSVFLPRRLL